MTYLITCPGCHQPGIDPRYSPSACLNCQARFIITGYCPTCHGKLTKFQCCAVNFFCDHCNCLISKRQVEFQLTAEPPAKPDALPG